MREHGETPLHASFLRLKETNLMRSHLTELRLTMKPERKPFQPLSADDMDSKLESLAARRGLALS